jgi:hypothetical protein
LTTDDEFWSVVQLMVAPVVVIAVTVTAEITGGGVVVKLELAEVDEAVDPFTETTSKSYVVPGVRPVIVTE